MLAPITLVEDLGYSTTCFQWHVLLGLSVFKSVIHCNSCSCLVGGDV